MERNNNPKNTIRQRACANCRLRKVRCSRIAPCSNCVTASLACPLDTASQRANNIPKTHSLEEHDALVERIKALESTVQSILGHQPNVSDQNRHSSSEFTSSSASSGRILVKRPPLIEGETSFKAQALCASQVEELNSPVVQQSPAFVQELANLKNALQDQETTMVGGDSVKADELDQTHALDVELPSPTFIMQLLQLMTDEGHTNLILFNFWGVQTLTSLHDLCKSTYFNTEPLTVTQKSSFNGIISLILREIGTEDRLNLNAGILSRMQVFYEKNF
ncbi:hypothetical protein DER45DRAFT_579137 [Fusarium avenaceum]|nr:hypothetical protein DER45DRAFT_579137 [Fusarium avenaceum]